MAARSDYSTFASIYLDNDSNKYQHKTMIRENTSISRGESYEPEIRRQLISFPEPSEIKVGKKEYERYSIEDCNRLIFDEKRKDYVLNKIILSLNLNDIAEFLSKYMKENYIEITDDAPKELIQFNKDINLVAEQSNCNKLFALAAMKNNKDDIVNSILCLTDEDYINVIL